MVLGIAYPLVVFGFGQLAVAVAGATARWSPPTASHTDDPSTRPSGSELLGQLVDDPDLFQPRPSAAGDGYDTLSTYGSNYGPEEPALVDAIAERRAEVAEREGVDESAVPPDAVTASASGLDPDISVAYAELQVPRVAAATGLRGRGPRPGRRAHLGPDLGRPRRAARQRADAQHRRPAGRRDGLRSS